jgi:protein-tyrosine phosphatase
MVRPWYWPENGQPHRTEAFTWIDEGEIAASWWPDPYVFDIYKKQGIKVIINCSEFDNKNDVPSLYNYYHIEIPDFGTPTDKQLERFLEICDTHSAKGEPIVVHCVAGCGRTGQLLVAWATYNGKIPENMDPVDWVRQYRECSLETKEQMKVARRIFNKLKNSQ